MDRFVNTGSSAKRGMRNAECGMRNAFSCLLPPVSCLLLLFSIASPASAQWVVRSTNVGSISIYGAYFWSPEEGWMVGAKGAVLRVEGGEVASPWEQPSSRTDRTLYDVHFVDAREGWVVGASGTVLHTVDGGENWRLQPSGTTNALNAVYFVDSEEGWAVGSRGTILYTVNGGNSWARQASGATQALRDVLFVNAEEGWAVGGGGMILHTMDGGQVWEAQESPVAGVVVQLRRLRFVDGREGWIVGSRGAILYTTDGGVHWEEVPSGTRNALEDIVFVSPEEGWIVGGGGEILHTMDGGRTWLSESETTGLTTVGWLNLRRVFFFGRDHGLFVDWKGSLLTFRDETDLEVPTGMVARAAYVAGGAFAGQHPWGLSGLRLDIDGTSEPGWILPARMGTSVNLAQRGLSMGGSVWTTWPESPFDAAEGLRAVDGDAMSGYLLNTSETDLARSGTIFLDLGAPFRLDRVVLRPVTDESMIKGEDEEFYVLQRAEIGLNDGDPANVDGFGNPNLTPVWGDRIDSYVTFPGWRMNMIGAWYIFDYPGIEVTFPEQIARYVGISLINADLFSLGEIEVYGQDNFVPSASYESDLIDFGGVASFGKIWWRGETPLAARTVIRTRSGDDDTPEIYWQIVGTGRSARETHLNSKGEPLTRDEYLALDEKSRAGVTSDMEHWSPWSEPYDLEAGQTGLPIVSPEPRRYFQFRIDFLNSPTAAGKMDYLVFEYSNPPAADELLGEIHPVQVKPAAVTTFVYSIRPTIMKRDMGFDSLEILTPVPVDRIRSVRIDGEEVSFTHRLRTDPTRFVVHFRHIDVRDSWGLLEVVFDSVVLRYGTEFVGWVFDSTSDLVAQSVVAGDVREDFDGDEITVNTELETPLIESVEVVPNPFTPNGDGLHDEVTFGYTILKLVGVAPVTIDLYALSGMFLRTLYTGYQTSGIYQHTWDGRDDEGALLRPGIYVYRIRVRADAGVQVRMGTVSVVY